MFPQTGAVEIICPVKEANLLAERTKSEAIILSMVLVVLTTLLSTISIAYYLRQPLSCSQIRDGDMLPSKETNVKTGLNSLEVSQYLNLTFIRSHT